RMQALQSPFTF
nr:immunoglobulin light chain junction region [Macaca mulatta]